MLLAETFSCLIARTSNVNSLLLMPYLGRDAFNEGGTAGASAMSEVAMSMYFSYEKICMCLDELWGVALLVLVDGCV